MKQTYSDKDSLELTELAESLWDIDYETKRIKRKKNVIDEKVPIKAIYHLSRKDRRLNEESRKYFHPFVQSNFKNIFGLNTDWHISVKDRKYLEKNMYLFAEDGKTILIDPTNKSWFETTWFNLVSIATGISGLIVGIIATI